jgi:hypothetical protein
VEIVATKKYVRQPGRSAAVLKMLQANKGKELHIGDISDTLGLTPTQITGAISHLRHKFEIVSQSKGWYRYNGNGTDLVRVESKATVVALMKDDRVLLDIEGKLYVAYELEVD